MDNRRDEDREFEKFKHLKSSNANKVELELLHDNARRLHHIEYPNICGGYVEMYCKKY